MVQVADGDIGVEAADGLDEAGRRTGVQAVLVVQGQLDARGRGPVATPSCGGLGRSDAEQLGLDLSGLRGVGGDLGQRRAGGGESDGGDEAFDDRAIRQHDGAVARVAAQLEGQFRAEHGAAEIHDDEHTVGRGDAVDGFFHSGGVGAEYVAVETGGDLDGWRCAADHLQRELDGGVGQPAAVGNDDDPDHGELTFSNAMAAASNSNAAEVAPGSWWPALRSPR